MKKSKEYLEDNKQYLHTDTQSNYFVSINDTQTYGKIVALEKEIEYLITDYNYQESAEVKIEIEKRKSEIDKLMKL
jgi:hypothetical protein